MMIQWPAGKERAFKGKGSRMEATWTILKVLQWTTGYFTRKGIEQPRANAEVLLSHVLGLERLQLYLRYDQPLVDGELARYRKAVQRRAAHEPTQYITGRQEFWSLEFEVNPSVLIPRPETEILVEKALESLGTDTARALDLGTGSGAIAVTLAHECPSLGILATDRSPEALVVARRNAIRHRVDNRIAFVAMDLFGAIDPARVSFDIIVSNPPYIDNADLEKLAPEVIHHEPASALLGGGTDGLGLILKILNQSPPYLKPGGTILLEIGFGQAEILKEKLPTELRSFSVEFFKDYSGILRVLQLKKVHG